MDAIANQCMLELGAGCRLPGSANVTAGQTTIRPVGVDQAVQAAGTIESSNSCDNQTSQNDFSLSDS